MYERHPHYRISTRTFDPPEESVILPFPKTAKFVRHDRLGGLFKSYSRKAA